MTHVQTPPAPLIVERARAEFLEMPGLTLTVRQAARLWGLDVEESADLLQYLADEGLLRQDARGLYRRRGCPACA